MSESRLASLAVGLLGFFVIIQSLPLIHSMIWHFIPSSLTGVEINDLDKLYVYRLYLLSSPLITLILAFFLIMYRNKIGMFLLGDGKQEHERIFNANHYHAAAISIVGLYFMLKGFSYFAGHFLSEILHRRVGELDIAHTFLTNLPYAIEFILGMCLFFGAHSIVAFWKTLWFRAKSEQKNREA